MDLFGRKRIAQLEESLETQTRLFNIQQEGWRAMEARWRDLAKLMQVNNLAMGRIIAKIDPTFAQDELDPKRKAASDAIGEEVLRKISANDHFSNRTRDF